MTHANPFVIPSLTIGAVAVSLTVGALVGAPASATPIAAAAPTAVTGNCNMTPYPSAPEIRVVRANPKPTRGKVKVKWKYRHPNQAPSNCQPTFQITSSQGADSGPQFQTAPWNCEKKTPCVKQGQYKFYIVFWDQPQGQTTFTVNMWYQQDGTDPGQEPQGPSSSKTSKSVKIK